MKIAITGATGFIGRYLVKQLSREGHSIRALCRASSNKEGLPDSIEWVEGELNDPACTRELISKADQVVHSAVYRPGGRFQNNDVELSAYLETNFMGSIRILEEAKRQNVQKLVYISTCAVHDLIMDDRPLDEAHPLWAKSHYGAHKAAVEKFIHSYGFGESLPFCALRPTGVYGVRTSEPQKSKWYDLIKEVAAGNPVTCSGGGKEVHASDVARAIRLLLNAKDVSGQVYNCYDRYISEYDVAHIAKELSGSQSEISGEQPSPKNQIQTGKLMALGMEFGGDELLRDTIQALIETSH